MSELPETIPHTYGERGRYVLRRRLGEGGWSYVFEADDTRLHTQVALKVLKPEITSPATVVRFEQEIKTVAGLHHPHIVHVTDWGIVERPAVVMWCAMQLAGPDTLRARMEARQTLALPEVCAVARDIASALEYAHAKRVIHRDIKPENILLSPGGAQLTDFGIARVATDSGAAMTTEGYKGTRHYSSPEQQKGDADLDGGADQYSLACVLFEALAGHRPYIGPDVVDQHLHAPIPSVREWRPDATPAMDAALQRALAKRRGDRYPSVEAFAEAFQAEGPRAVLNAAPNVVAGRRARPRAVARIVAIVLALSAWPLGKWWRDTHRPVLGIAMLPCEYRGTEPVEDWRVASIAEAIIAELSTVPRLRVIGFQSVRRFAQSTVATKEIGDTLRVPFVATCRVSWTADSVAVTVQVDSALTGGVRVTETYADAVRDIQALQVRVAQGIAATLSRSQKSSATATQFANAEADALYRRGLSKWNSGAFEDLRQSAMLFDSATSVDASYARAFAGLADAHLSFVGRWMADSRNHFPLARKAAARALQLQPDLGQALAARGRLAYRGDWNWTAAARDFRRALEVTPSAGIIWLDQAKLLSVRGQHEQAIESVLEARRTSPIDPFVLVGVSEVYYAARRYEASITAAEEALAIAPSFQFGHLWKAMALISLHRPAEAVEVAQEAVRRVARHPGALAILARAQAEAGQRDAALATLAEMDRAPSSQYVPPTLKAVVHVGLGDLDAAMRTFEQAADERDWFVAEVAVHPLADGIRGHARYPALLRRLHLDDVVR